MSKDILPDAQNQKTTAAFSRLYDITRTLRGADGCPWDKDQTPLSLRRSLMEESFEAIDAMTSGDVAHVREELGDVFFNVVLLAYLYEQAGDFTLAQSLNDICDKLIRRHPHVFPESEGKSQMTAPVTDTNALLSQWDAIKENLEGRKGASVLDGVPQGFPPLLRAYKLLKKAAKANATRRGRTAFQARQTVDDALQTVRTAADSVAQAKHAPADEPFTVSGGSAPLNAAQLHLESAVGDAFFALVDYARTLGVDPAVALDGANRRFIERFKT